MIVKGITLGLISGLIVTLFDGLYMLTPNIYVPHSYPLLLITFNTVFWTIIGGLSGFFLWVFTHKREDLKGKENFYWVLFFFYHSQQFMDCWEELLFLFTLLLLILHPLLLIITSLLYGPHSFCCS